MWRGHASRRYRVQKERVALENALRNNGLFTLDWSRYDLLTPVMKAKVNPALMRLLHFWGNYSFYVLKWLKGKARRGPEHRHV